jgi:hypothetical protein
MKRATCKSTISRETMISLAVETAAELAGVVVASHTAIALSKDCDRDCV